MLDRSDHIRRRPRPGFYGTVFGWTFDSAGPEYGGYVNAAKDGHPVAGIMANRPEAESPDHWATYFHTAEINTTLAAVTKAGGQIEGLPDLADEDLGEGLYNALFMVSMAEIAASDWRGVKGRDGKPLIFDAGLIASLFQDQDVVAHFRSEYFRPIHEVEAEGNV